MLSLDGLFYWLLNEHFYNLYASRDNGLCQEAGFSFWVVELLVSTPVKFGMEFSSLRPCANVVVVIIVLKGTGLQKLCTFRCYLRTLFTLPRALVKLTQPCQYAVMVVPVEIHTGN